MREFSYLELGATLFIPATHKHLEAIILENKYPELKSVVIDLEDSIDDEQTQEAYERVKQLLEGYKPKKLLVFIRPKNIAMLEQLLFLKGILNIDGFVLPKFSLTNAKAYLEFLEPFKFFVMPSIEAKELFNLNSLIELREIILASSVNIKLIRFGLEDMLSQLKMKRPSNKTYFKLSSVSYVVGSFIATFKSAGFAISGGVYPYFNDTQGFLKEVQKELEEGLFSKTIIHPNQIKPLHDLYKVSQKEFNEALYIMENNHNVSSYDGKMVERKTQLNNAQEIVLRAEVYGVV